MASGFQPDVELRLPAQRKKAWAWQSVLDCLKRGAGGPLVEIYAAGLTDDFIRRARGHSSTSGWKPDATLVVAAILAAVEPWPLARRREALVWKTRWSFENWRRESLVEIYAAGLTDDFIRWARGHSSTSGWKPDATTFRVSIWGQRCRNECGSDKISGEAVMSCVCVLTPVVIAAWPTFSAAVVSAAVSLGYSVVDEAVTVQKVESKVAAPKRINLEIEQSEIVTGQLGRDKQISVARDGIVVRFSRDARGRASLCVEGQGHSEASLRAAGEELSQRVVQKYVYDRLMTEMNKREFHVVEEEVTEDNSIRIKVRRWDS